MRHYDQINIYLFIGEFTEEARQIFPHKRNRKCKVLSESINTSSSVIQTGEIGTDIYALIWEGTKTRVKFSKSFIKPITS